MFSWKKQNPPSQQRQQREAPQTTDDYSDLIAQGRQLANEDIDPGEGDDDMGDFGDEDLGDLDLDDPELLAELQGLTGETPAPKPKPKPTPTASVAPTPTEAAPRAQSSASLTPQRQAPAAKPTSGNVQSPAQLANKPSPSTTPAGPPSLAGLGVDLQGVMEDEDDEEVELTEDDWKDPQFLAQLQSLGGHVEHHDQNASSSSGAAAEQTAAPVPKVVAPVPKVVAPAPIHAAQATPISMESGPLSTAGSFLVTEQEPVSASSSMIATPSKDRAFNDQDLDGDSFMAEQQQDEPKAPQELPVTSPTSSKPTKRLEDISKTNHKDLLKLLQTRDVQYKRAALDAKRAGDMTLAAERVKTFKSLQKWIALVEAGGFLDLELYPIPDEPLTVAASSTKVADLTGTPTAATSSSAVPSSTRSKQDMESEVYSPPITSSAPEATTHVSSSIAEASADDMRSRSGVHGSFGGGIEFKQLAADDDFQIVSNSDDDTYDMLQSQLESQIKMCTTTCAYYHQAGDKLTALEFHKLNKIFKTDLMSLQSYRTHGKKAPAFHFQDVRFELELGFYQEIGLNDLSLNIIRAWDLSHKDVRPTDLDSYVSWDLGWPTENMPGAGNGKGTTPTVKRTPKPDFNYSKTVDVGRSKAFDRFVERRKVTFEVWHYRGLLWKDYLIGRAQVPLLSLLNHSEIHEIIPLIDPATRRNTGGKIEIKIRLQRPLLKPEIVVKEEKWLVIDEFNSSGLGFPTPTTAMPATSRSNASPLTGAGRVGTPVGRSTKATVAAPAAPASRSTPARAARQLPAPVPSAPKQSSTPKQPAAAAAVPTSPARASNAVLASPKVSTLAAKIPVPAPASLTAVDDLEDNESDKALSELNSVELLVSNKVLGSEMQHAQQMIHDARAVGNNDAAEEHQDRLTQLEIKMKLLVLQVQTGQLTMEGYCQMVNARVVKDKKLAIELKRLGLVPEAMRALARSKIMTQEMKEVEDAMAAQGEEEEEE